jgi:hypothetical protein
MALKEIFTKRWPAWLAGLLLGIINVIYYLYAAKPFTIYTGFYHWGSNILSNIGFKGSIPPMNPLYDKTSIGDIGLLLGASLAAILAGEFRIRKAATKLDYVESSIGGILMALGVSLSYGCNWGGFFSAITALSLHGFAMFLGLIIGGYIGLRYVIWRSTKIFEIISLSSLARDGSEVYDNSKSSKGDEKKSLVMLFIIIMIILVLSSYYYVNNRIYIPLLLFGVLIGVVIQRSSFCFVTAFRDLFYGPEFRRSISIHKGIIIGLLIGVSGIAVAKYKGFIDPLSYVNPVNFTNIVGGILFGFGAVLVGGCASGSLWRLGEGHIKILPGLITTVLTYPIFATYIKVSGVKIFPPLLLGWDIGLLMIYLFIFLYLAFIFLLEKRSRKG